MPFDESPAVRRINALCSPAPARYLHLPTGIHWVVIDSLGEVIQLENIERRRRLIPFLTSKPRPGESSHDQSK